MKTNKTNMFLLLNLSLSLFTVSGCTLPQKPIDIVVMPQAQSPQQARAVANRFSEQDPQKPTVVESAMALSEKYAELSREAATLKQQNKELLTENQRRRAAQLRGSRTTADTKGINRSKRSSDRDAYRTEQLENKCPRLP